MAITRWDPYREVVALQNRMNSLFRNMNEEDDPVAASSFVPAVDIYEDAQKVMLKLEVPGIDQKEMDAQMMQEIQTLDDQDVISNFDPLKDLPQPVQAEQTNPSNQSNQTDQPNQTM